MARRGVLLGLDSLMWRFCRRFMAEGRMPNLERMAREGCVTELVSTFPPLTGTAWSTIASGAWPSTTGVEDHFVHYEGEPFFEIHRAYDSRVVRAERVWETAERTGRTPMLLKFPVTWPPTITRGYQYSGCGGYADQDCEFQIAHVRCFTNDPTAVDVQGWSVTPVDRVTFQKAYGWSAAGQDLSSAMEAEISITPERGGRPKRYFVLVASDASGMWKALLCPTKDTRLALCGLAHRQWSDWLEDEFSVSGRIVRGYFKAKMVELTPRGERFKLYFSTIHATDGYSVPQDLAGRIYRETGPLWEEVHVHDYPAGWIDDETWTEICTQHTESMARTIRYMMRTLPWDIFWLQWHPIDYTLHQFWPGIDPNFPAHDPRTAEQCWNVVGTIHELADRMVGTVMELLDADTVFCVTGDHGHTRWHTTISFNNLLVKEGLICVNGFEGDQALVDWTKTKAFCDCGESIFLNVKGRDPDGCVEYGEEYERLRGRVIELLSELRDPETGGHVVDLVVPREAARAFGLFGGGVGDVVFSTRSGYRSIVRGRDGWTRNFGITPDFQVFTRRKPFVTLTSEHGQFSPWNPDLYTVSVWSGPGIKKGKTSPSLGRLVDIAPTFCYLTGLSFPKHCEGSVLWDVLEEDRK